MKNKLIHSVELIRKAEKLALRYDPENGFFNTFSAGKDSQAMYYIMKMAGVKFQTHMNFTSVDPPQVVRFVKTQFPDVIRHAPKKSIYQLAVEYGILPSMRIRWCCAEFKESAGAGKVTTIGIRKQESARRARRHEVEVSNKKFSGNLDEFEQWQKEQIEKKEAKLMRKMKREGKKVNEDYFSANKENEVRCINGKDSILMSPIFEWTDNDVWYFLNEVIKAPHCELYDQGYKRIGCILCPMSQYKQKVREMKDFPYVKRNWIKAIKEIRRGGYSKENLSGGTSERIGASSQQQQGSSSIGITPPLIRKEVRQESIPPSVSATTSGSTTMGGRRWSWGHKELPRHPTIREWELPPPPPQDIGTGSKTQGFGLDSAPRQEALAGFSDSPSASGEAEGRNEPTEDEIAEKIFSWWTSGLSYSKWYADTYLQQKIDFGDDEGVE